MWQYKEMTLHEINSWLIDHKNDLKSSYEITPIGLRDETGIGYIAYILKYQTKKY